MNTKELVAGLVFDRLTLIEEAPRRNGRMRWRCRCKCGREVVVLAYCIGKNTRSCGCLHGETVTTRNTSHGLSQTPEYNVWTLMLSRCHNQNNRSFKNYGGRGIRVCERWRNSFAAFYEDMGPRPFPEAELDRIQNDGDYGPGNCRWTTATINGRNRRNNHRLKAFGQEKTIAEWIEDPRCKVSFQALSARVTRYGWDARRAIATPVPTKSSNLGPVSAFGETKTITDWSKDSRCKVDFGTLKCRVRRYKWDAEAAISTPARKVARNPTLHAFGETKSIIEWAKDSRCTITFHVLHSRLARGWGAENAILTPKLHA